PWDLTTCLERLPSRLSLPPVFGRWLGDQILASERLAAGLANGSQPRRLAAGEMRVRHGPTLLRRLAPGLAPSAQRQDHGIEGLAFLREMILVAQRSLVVGAPLGQPVRFQLLQSCRYHLRRGAGLRLDFLEAMHAHEQLAQDQHGPAVAYDAFGASNRTECLVSSVVLHCRHHVFFIRLVTMIFIAIWD